jgi:tripartite-type tricarboxylate transporter receptor subunit TctC
MDTMLNLIPVRRLAGTLLVVTALLLSPAAAFAQKEWPGKPVRIVVAFAAGGATDVFARMVAQPLSERLGQPVIVENRLGANGTIGTESVARAPADGYTLLMGTIATHSIQQSLLANLPYDPVRDFIPIVQVASQAYVVVVRVESIANSLADLTAMAKQSPGKLTYASAATGTAGHLFTELYRARAGIDIVAVQYKGSTPAMHDVLGGHVPFIFDVILTTMPHIRSGKLRPLAVTSAQRSPLLPDVATVAEQGFPGYDAVGWNGLYAPARTPQAVVEQLNREVNAVLAQPELRERVAALGASVIGGTPEQFARFMRGEAAKWGQLIRDHKIAAD